ncbi:tRNA-(ms[2]io[6]A)-hydroxylase [bacterium SCSIO 12741]|nr:tRNA-(ms[2]io[6]A)-hydroxylase [bacterium SCSIO 12741]
MSTKYNLKLSWDTPVEWTQAVLSDFDSFLQDHADCERKASSMAMSFIAKCPDRNEIIPELIETALEELVHFKLVYEVMEKRGVSLKNDMPQDEYINQLIKACRSGREERLMDRMIVASVVEARGAERFRLVAENHPDAEMQKFYDMLWKSEHKHSDIFLRLAEHYWPFDQINDRLQVFLEKEGNILSALPFKPALH